jgi:predicted AlkP superfamily pyrophosphatase or phosphodiesterase
MGERNRDRKRPALKPAVFAAVFLAATAPSTAVPSRSRGPARLVVFIVVDQARSDYFTRFRPLFRGGLHYLLEESAVFTDAHHDHAITTTAPGHASLATGCHPARSGIVDNTWFDRQRGRRVHAFGDPDAPILPVGDKKPSSPGRSPRNLLRSTLADWLKQRHPAARVFAVGGKDRGAVPLAGRSANGAYWFDSSIGQWVTSRYYRADYPAWVKRLHDEKIADSYFGKPWEPLPVGADEYRRAGILLPEGRASPRAFSYALGGSIFRPEGSFYSDVFQSPFVDDSLVAVAKALLDNEELGRDDSPDFLGLAFSAVDGVGHAYGPNSPEILDTFLRLDRALGELFAHIDATVGLQHVAFALSADHGVMPLPEPPSNAGASGKQLSTEDAICMQNVAGKLEKRFGSESWLRHGLYLDHAALARRNLRHEDVERELARLLEECPAVEKAWTRTELESPASTGPRAEQFRHSFHPGRSPDVLIQYKAFHTDRLGGGTSHGSPYDYDTHVPLLISVPGLAAGTVPERVRTVDLAPTLASLLGIPAPEGLDGVDRSERLRENAAKARANGARPRRQ